MTRWEKLMVICTIAVLGAIAASTWLIQRELTAIDLALIVVLDTLEKPARSH